MENKVGTRLITIIIIAVAVIVSIVLIIILDGAERSAIAAATSDNTILNPVIGSTEPTYEHDDFFNCSTLYKKEDNKVICYIQNTSAQNYSANYTVSYKDENNHEIGHATGKIDEILAGDYRFAIINKDIPENTAKVDLYAKAGTMNTNPIKLQFKTNVVNGNAQVTMPAYDKAISTKEIQVCYMDTNNAIIDVQIFPWVDQIEAKTPRDLGVLPIGTAKQIAVIAYGYIQQ